MAYIFSKILQTSLLCLVGELAGGGSANVKIQGIYISIEGSLLLLILILPPIVEQLFRKGQICWCQGYCLERIEAKHLSKSALPSAYLPSAHPFPFLLFNRPGVAGAVL